MNQEPLYKKPLVVAAGVIGLALILSMAIGAMTFYKIRSFDNTLVVTGSAKKSVTADSVKWVSNLSRTVYESGLQQGYAQIAKDSAIVQSFLAEKGMKPAEITVSPVFVDQVYKYNGNDSGPRQYTLRQTVTVSSSNVAVVTDMAKDSQDIINKGVIFSTQSPEYYYSKLADLRVSLLADAVRDAKARANELAKSSGRSVGVLKSASSGVVQVLAPNSVEVSDYGQYDTSSIEKDVMITARATFVVN